MQILTAQELHNLAMNIVGEKLREMGYEFQAINSQLKRHPQFVLYKKGEPTILITSSVKSNNNYEHPRSAGRKDPLKQNVLNQGAMEYVEIMYKELEISSNATSEKNGYEYEEVIGTGLDLFGDKKQFYIQRIQNNRYEITISASQSGGDFDIEEIRKLINTIEFK